VITKINLTRQGTGGRRWQPGKDAVICNVNHLGPSRDNRNLVSVHFSHYPTPPALKKKKSLHHAASIPSELSSQASKDIIHISHTETGNVSQHALYTDTYTEEQDMMHTGNQDTLFTEGQDTLHSEEQGTLHTGSQDMLYTRDQNTSCSNNSNLVTEKEAQQTFQLSFHATSSL